MFLLPRNLLSVIKSIINQFERYKEQIQFGFTITSNDNELLEFWEPNAPNFNERFEFLKHAFQKGFKTSVSVEPFLDYNPKELIRVIEPFVTESIWVGRMNYISRRGFSPYEIRHYDEIRKNYENNHLYELYTELVNAQKYELRTAYKSTFQRLASLKK
jgi:DNA repair photolyase